LIGRVRAISTPTALKLATWTLVIALLVFGAVGLRAATQRRDAVDTVRLDGAPLVERTEGLYVALADADAAASTAYLQAGLDPAELRARYDEDIRRAADELALIGRSSALSDNAREALKQINEQLPLYTAYIDSAATNNRLGHPLGASYQRRASEVMQIQLLPAATSLYKSAARRLDSGHRAGSSLDAEVAVVVAAAVVMVLLVGMQVFLTRRTRRLLNVGLTAAALIVAALCAWTVIGLRSQRGALAESQRGGSDPLIVLSAARILALRSLSDENLDLIRRDTQQASDFATVTVSISGDEDSRGLLDRAASQAVDAAASSGVTEIQRLHDQFLATHDRVRRLADEYDYDAAITLARNDEAAASDALDKAFASEITRSRSRLDARAGAAADELRFMPYVILVSALVAVAAVGAGMWPRLREYR